MQKTAWVVNKDHTLTRAEVLEAKPYKVIDKLGYELKLRADGEELELNTMLPNGNIFPAVYYQEEKPNLWFYRGRSLQIRDLDNETFSEDPKVDAMLRDRAKKMVPKAEPYKFLPHTESFIDGIIRGKPQFLVGKKGTGKSSIIEQICARTNWPFIRVNVTQVVVQDLVGTLLIQAGETVWSDGGLTLGARVGAMFNGDEFDFVMPEISSFFFPVLEQPPKLTLKEKPDFETVRFHDKFRFIATGNVMGQENDGEYVGTQPLNAALKSRFSAGQILEIQQMSTREEMAVIAQRIPWAPMNIIKRVSRMAERIRTSAYPSLDTRQLMSWTENVVLKRDYLEAALVTWLPVVKKASRQEAEDLVKRGANRVIIGKSAMSFAAGASITSKPGMPLQSVSDLPPKVDMRGKTAKEILDPDWQKAVYEAKEKYNLSFSAIEEHFNIRDRNGNNARDVWLQSKLAAKSSKA